MNKYFYWLALMFVSISAITSNKVMEIPAKMIIFFFIVIGICLGVFVKKIKISIHEIKIMILTLIFVLIWGGQGFIDGYDVTAFQQAIKVVTAFAIWIVFYNLINNRQFEARKGYMLLTTCFWTAIIFKFFLESLYISGFFSDTELVTWCSEKFSIEIMPLSIIDGWVTRIGTIVDVLPLSIFPFVYLCSNREKRIFCIIGVVLYSFVNFSRVYILQTIFFILLLQIPSQYKEIKIKTICIAIIIVCFASLGIGMAWDGVSDILYGRFLGDNAESSDYDRLIQFAFLVEGVQDSILWGHGLGSYIQGYVRSVDTPFLYELEYLALAYQTGILGLIYIFMTFVMIIKEFTLKGLNMRVKLLVIFNLVFLLLRPLTNPMLFASSSMMVLVFIYLYINVMGNKLDKEV